MIKLEKLEVGPLQTNCYFIIKEEDLIIVDPGDDFEVINQKIGNLKLKAIFITHDHFDHVGALEELLSVYNVPVNPSNISNFNYEIISTPGHTKDSITFYFKEEGIMFTGDFLFLGTIGRTDLPTASNEEMKQSLKEIKQYPDETIIYPGHGEETTLGDEKKLFNSYFDYLLG